MMCTEVLESRKEKRKFMKKRKILRKITLCGCRYHETEKEKVSPTQDYEAEKMIS